MKAELTKQERPLIQQLCDTSTPICIFLKHKSMQVAAYIHIKALIWWSNNSNRCIKARLVLTYEFQHFLQIHFRNFVESKGSYHCHWWTFVDVQDVKTQHFKEMLYKPIILVMEIHELWWPNLDMVVHEISLPKWLDYTGLPMKCCVLTSWTSMVVHERPLVAMEVHGQFRLGGHML